MYGTTQCACAFTMNNSDLQNAALLAFLDVHLHKLFDLARLECVQVQYTVNWQFNPLIVHGTQAKP